MKLAVRLVLCSFVFFARNAYAEVKPHRLFSDGAVLQQGMNVPVWGTAKEGEKVTVKFNGQSATTSAREGKWIVKLSPMKAGGPFSMTIAGDNTVEIKNVLIGEVWICSGQSNMQWPVSQSANPQETAAGARDPMLRLFTVDRRATDEVQTDLTGPNQGGWAESAPETVTGFSAVAYFFGRDLRKALNVPVGLINTSYGGTPAEAWTSRAALESQEELRSLFEDHARAIADYPQALRRYQTTLDEHKQASDRARAAGQQPPAAPRTPPNPAASAQRPAGLYNAMIAPLIPYAIKGAIWYQGESNAGNSARAVQYRTLFPAMIRDWRSAWGQGHFPFLFVQLAPFMSIVTEPQESAWAELREAQTLTARVVPATAQIVITDAGDPTDIHPKKKEPVGARLALAARALAYGERVVHSGPNYQQMRFDGNEAVINFRNVGGGLVAQGGPLKGFTIAGEDGKFVNATAEIRGNRVIVKSPQVTRPRAVRFGWANYPVVNLYNKEGLPASPFRTDGPLSLSIQYQTRP